MLRAATLEDAEPIARVLIKSRRAFLPYAPSRHTDAETLNWVTQHLIPSGGVTVAVIDEGVVGVLAVSEDAGAVWIEQLYLLPSYVNQSLGSRLLAQVHRQASKPVRLFTFQQNTSSRRFYERHGYKALALSDGSSNEEKCPDVLYELSSCTDA